MDCTGCAVCAVTCPSDALTMKPFSSDSEENKKNLIPNWNYCVNVPYRKELADPTTPKGSQFLRPYFEFCGACAGCGESAYMKLVS